MPSGEGKALVPSVTRDGKPIPTRRRSSNGTLTVLQCLRRGMRNAEIAGRLGIVERTVKAHVTAILMKLHATDRAGAVARGFDLGLLRVTTGMF